MWHQMACPTFFGKGPHLLLWACLQVAFVKTSTGKLNTQNYCVPRRSWVRRSSTPVSKVPSLRDWKKRDNSRYLCFRRRFEHGALWMSQYVMWHITSTMGCDRQIQLCMLAHLEVWMMWQHHQYTCKVLFHHHFHKVLQHFSYSMLQWDQHTSRLF